MNLAALNNLYDILSDSFEEAARTGHYTVEIDHIFLALLRRRKGEVCNILRSNGVKINQLKAKIDDTITTKEMIDFDRVDEIQPGENVEELLKLMVDESYGVYEEMGPAQLLLAISKMGHSVGASFLLDCGLTYGRIKQLVDFNERKKMVEREAEEAESVSVKSSGRSKKAAAKEKKSIYSPAVVASLAESLGRVISSSDGYLS